MLNRVEKAFDLHSQVDFEGLFHFTSHQQQQTHTWTSYQGSLLNFGSFLLMQKVPSVCYFGGRKKNTCFQLLFF
jgi:hypothetical protein